jgi:thioredoxin reductase (NADPH)
VVAQGSGDAGVVGQPQDGDGEVATGSLAISLLRLDGEEAETSWLFVYIGAAPRTDWLGEAVVRDSHGFIITGNDLLATNRTAWPLARAPYALESSLPGVFAAGDVRLDSMKRVASAVGEGAMTVYLVHRYLASM